MNLSRLERKDLDNSPEQQIDFSKLEWTPDKIIRDLEQVLNRLNRQLRIRKFSLEGVSIAFVQLQDLRSKYFEITKDMLPYGGDLQSKVCAYSERTSNTTHEIKIGVELGMSQAQAFEYLCHEYGHTLGPKDLDAFLEELKAYAFETLAMSVWKNLDYYEIDAQFDESFHSQVSAQLACLVEKGVDPMQILANLTRESFGSYKPNKKIRIISKVVHSRARLTCLSKAD